MKKVIFAALIISLIFISGCILFPENCDGHYFGEEWQDGSQLCVCEEIGIVCERAVDVIPPTGITFEFTVGDCDGSVDPYDESELGIQEVNWINEFTLEVIADVSINCAEEIEDAYFEQEGNKITLKYFVPDCFETELGCMECLCGHRIIYTFFNIENADYEFELERINPANPEEPDPCNEFKSQEECESHPECKAVYGSSYCNDDIPPICTDDIAFKNCVSKTENPNEEITKIIDILDNPEDYEGREVILDGTYGGSNSMGGEYEYPEALDCDWSKMGILSKSYNDVTYDETGCLVFGNDVEILENFIMIDSKPTNDVCNDYDTWELCESHPECEGFYADSPCEPNTICPDAISFWCVSKNNGSASNENSMNVGNEIKIRGTVMTNLVLEEKKPYLN